MAGKVTGVDNAMVLECEYPLKLMKTKGHFPTLFMLNYGGGLVDQDLVELIIHLTRSDLTLKTQGSTKVYKSSRVRQYLDVTLQNSSLKCLPHPVSCFKDSTFVQIQKFRLFNSTLLVLDWATCGRHLNGEIWQMNSATFENWIYVDNVLLLRDAWRISQDDYLRDFTCFCTVYSIGFELNLESIESKVLYCSSSVNGISILKLASQSLQDLTDTLKLISPLLNL